jgi:hypothetical protein
MEAGVAGTSQLCQPLDDVDQQQSELQTQLQHADTQDAAGNSEGSSTVASNSQRPRWRQRLIRYGIAAIQAVLALEVAVVLLGPLLSSAPVKAKKKDQSDSEDFDPADILMDYFTGRRGRLMWLILSWVYQICLLPCTDSSIACACNWASKGETRRQTFRNGQRQMPLQRGSNISPRFYPP